MMELVFVNQSSYRLPRKFIEQWMRSVERELPSRDRRKVARGALTVVFLDASHARKLNRQFRGRNYATDVLSFPGMEPGSLGELVLCPKVIERQAREHGLSHHEELGYMLL